MIKLNICVACEKSLMCVRVCVHACVLDNRGPRSEPHGTLIVIGTFSDFISSISMYCLPFFK